MKIRSLKSYGRHLIAVMAALVVAGSSLAFWRTWVVAVQNYDSAVVDQFDYLSLFLDDKLRGYQKAVQFWGFTGISMEAEQFMMSFPEIRGLLLSDRKGTIRWSNLPYVQGGMVIPSEMLSGKWIPSSLFGDVSSPGLIISVPIPSGWLICEIDSYRLLSSIRIRAKEDTAMALVSSAGQVLYSWSPDLPVPIGSVLPRALLAERSQNLDLSIGRARAFSRMLVGGLFLVSVYPESVLFQVSAVQALSVALLILVGSGLFLVIFWRGYERVSSSFSRWVQFLFGASERVNLCDNSLEMSEYLVDFDHQMGALEPSFTEEGDLRDAFGILLRTLSDKEETLMAYLEETKAMEDSLRMTNADLELAMGQLENILCLAQGVTDGRTLQGMASNMAENLKKTFRCSFSALVALNRGVPYIWGEAGNRSRSLSLDKLSFRDKKICDESRTLIVPVHFMDKVAGYVVMEGCGEYSQERVSEVLRRFALTLGGLLHANELLTEVRSSFHYFALRMQAFTEIYHEETGGHIARVGEYAAFIARELGRDEAYVEDIRVYAQLHDLGKVRVSRDILTKPGALTEDEFREMKRHAPYGADMLGDSAWLEMARNICRYHHERWDGSGYPEGLSGEAIPLEGRIVSLCDVYDALREERSYKPAFSHEEASRIILKGDGRVMPGHFDPEVLDIFRVNGDFFRDIHVSIADNHQVDRQSV
ncbi:HD-GYP domain-containing protein [Dethiosulfovibrio salsuginis]|uniref:HD domain-containing protein n=1 Tax=Dethiosulfovibrio salsuginis TaxID=561720 RepID=A0A1X7IJK7_9BACT|nr:HD-GYP domain-containing protein [Dethiosulfovibrio salsuginis]SMG15020.1 HD domain-containing protein [Dethiosulfovibrio salsuginis]